MLFSSRLRIYRFDENTQECSVLREIELPPNMHAPYFLKLHGEHVLVYRPLLFEVWICDWASKRTRTVIFTNEHVRIPSCALQVVNSLLV